MNTSSSTVGQSITDRLKKTVFRFDTSDTAELRDFQRKMFGERVWQVDESYNRWLFDEVPDRDADGPQVWVCKRQGHIVGQQCGIPFRLKARDREIPASWANSLMVLPEWRMRGAFTPLSEAQLDSRPLAMAIHISDSAYKAYTKAGWIDIGALPAYVFPLNTRRCLEASSLQGRMRTIGTIAGPALHGVRIASHLLGRATGARFEEIGRFDGRADTIWRRASPHYPLIALRDLKHLRWRYDEIPCASAYRRFILTRGGKPLGYVVLRRETWRKEPCLAIVDYLCEPKWLWVLLSHTLRIAARERATALICRTLNARAERTFLAMGMMKVPDRVGFPVRVMAHAGPDAGIDRAEFADRGNWLLTMGDGDASFLMHNTLPEATEPQPEGVAVQA